MLNSLGSPTRALSGTVATVCPRAQSHDPPRLFEDPDAAAAQPVEPDVGEDSGPAPDWSEQDVVGLHWLLLKQVQRLADPETPFAEKIWTLNWVFTDPEKDALPFSFVNCVKVVSCSPLSPLPFIGDFDVSDLRDLIAHSARRWMRESVERFPPWVQETLRRNPAAVLAQLERNPQYLNEQIRERQSNGDLFA
ncbi:MAG: hypothetical protein IPL03_00250 [Sterolibacteriaceae bacterium]|nr:hypothetical protein [Candidatus Methylophosphatis haderslevensis]